MVLGVTGSIAAYKAADLASKLVQAGAGIVADSDPSREYEETLNKAQALLQAVAMVSGG